MKMKKQMKMKKAVVFAFAGIVSAAAFATDWYVDANNGNDSWDGTTAAIPSQEVIDQCTAQGVPVHGPRKTLHAMMSDECVQPGHVVKAAEGDYNEGGVVNGTKLTVNRVQIKAGVKLVATGSRDATFITGSGGSGTGAYTNGAVRCVNFLAPTGDEGYGIVRGFTLRDGRTAPSSTKENGGASIGAGLLVDCVLENNGCGEAARGGTMKGGTALRCHFKSCDNSYLAHSSSSLIDSVILVGSDFLLYQGCKAYNCTFVGNSYVRAGYTYNCLFIGSGAGNASQKKFTETATSHKNTFSRSAFHETSCTTNETCRVVTAEETPYDATTFRPLAGSVAIDAGDMSYYVDATNGWKAAWLAECGKDYYGGERVANGTIDVGCGEVQTKGDVSLSIVDESTGLVVDGAEIGTTNVATGSSLEITFSRNFTSDRLCTGVNVDGVFHSFGGTTSNVPCVVSVPTTFALGHTISAVYETDQKDWYVSPTGNDANKGYHRDCPRKTLVKAMELATENADNIVHAAAGTYNEGEAWAGYSSNRVVVAKGVGLVADDWPSQETVIQGASATAEGEADKYGNGTNAVRCAYVLEGGYVKGFKLTGGRTQRGSSSGVQRSGGGALISGGALIDCELTGNGCGYRGRGVFSTDSSGTIIRCYVHDHVCGSYEINNGMVVDSYVKSSSYPYYGSGKILNSTMLGDQVRSNTQRLRILNTYLQKACGNNSNKAYCTNCVFTGTAYNSTNTAAYFDPDTCSFSADTADNLDENFRPKTAASKLVDAGSKELYDANFPAAWVQFKTNRDWKDGQRIYNAQIDVGCGEYDFRPTFAGYLGDRAVISEMGPNVTTNSVPNVVVPEGESIALSASPTRPCAQTQYELVYTPEGGEETVVVETSTESFSRTLDGPCTVQSFVGRSTKGLMILVF